MNLLTKVIATSVLLVVLSLVTLRTEIGAQFISHLRPIFNALEFTETNNVVSHDSQIGGDNLNFTSNKMNWDGVSLVSQSVDLGVYNSLAFSSDFTHADDSACVGGTGAGTDCKSRCATGDLNAGSECTVGADCDDTTSGDGLGTCDANYDCPGGGVCTANKQSVIGLSANVYRQGMNILSTDMPLRVLRTDASRDMGPGVRINFSDGALNIPIDSTSRSSSTATGDTAYTTDSAPQPMVAVGDGTDAIPMRACFQINAGPHPSNPGLSNTASHSYYSSELGVINSTTTGADEDVLQVVPVDMTISNLACETHEDMAGDEVFTATLWRHFGTVANASDGGKPSSKQRADTKLKCVIQNTTYGSGTSGANDRYCLSSARRCSDDDDNAGDACVADSDCDDSQCRAGNTDAGDACTTNSDCITGTTTAECVVVSGQCIPNNATFTAGASRSDTSGDSWVSTDSWFIELNYSSATSTMSISDPGASCSAIACVDSMTY